jgi:phosphoinositide-3-kinase regulatory subunit 4
VEWTPKGILVARLTEHRQPVNELSVSRDNLFFVTGSDDGTVKVWDCTRLQATARAQSHLSYSQGGRVTSVAVCDSSHSVCSASTNGTVHVFKVEVAGLSSKEDSPRYVGLTDIKRIDASEGAVLQVAHFNTLTESMLVLATQCGGVHGWDLRSWTDSFRLQMESPAMGLISAMAVGLNPYAIVVGTTMGFICLWDLRFRTATQIWRHSAKTKITKLSVSQSSSLLPRRKNPQHPTQGPLVLASAQGTNELCAFDLYTSECRLVFRITDTTASAQASFPSAAQTTNNNMPASRTASKQPPVLPVLYSYLNGPLYTQRKRNAQMHEYHNNMIRLIKLQRHTRTHMHTHTRAHPQMPRASGL